MPNAGFDHVPAPQRPVAVEGAAAGEMKGGNRVDGERQERRTIRPNRARAPARSRAIPETGHAEGYHEGGAAARGQAAQRGEIEVVVMIVAQQDGVDGRQPVEFHAGQTVAARPEK